MQNFTKLYKNKGLEILARDPCSVNGAMMINVNAAKEELRNKYKAIRLAMGPAEVEENSQVICQELLSEIDWSRIKLLHTYSVMAKLNEVDLSEFLSVIRQKHPRIKITIGNHAKNETPSKKRFDLILVPILAFDKHHHRLGWGGGWYDRFLAGQPQALKIGLCFQNGFIEPGIPHELHDVSLDKIITEV